MKTLHMYVMRAQTQAALTKRITGVERPKDYLAFQVRQHLGQHIYIRENFVFTD